MQHYIFSRSALELFHQFSCSNSGSVWQIQNESATILAIRSRKNCPSYMNYVLNSIFLKWEQKRFELLIRDRRSMQFRYESIFIINFLNVGNHSKNFSKFSIPLIEFVQNSVKFTNILCEEYYTTLENYTDYRRKYFSHSSVFANSFHPVLVKRIPTESEIIEIAIVYEYMTAIRLKQKSLDINENVC